MMVLVVQSCRRIWGCVLQRRHDEEVSGRWLVLGRHDVRRQASKIVTPLPTLQVVDEMRQRLNADASQHQNEGWNKVWTERLTPWDLGRPTPALVSELANDLDRNASWWEQRSSNNSTSLYSLIPGCGSGYDIRTLAHHHDHVISKSHASVRDSVVVGLDISPVSLDRAKTVVMDAHVVNESVSNESQCSFANCDSSSSVPPLAVTTRIELVMGNFFDRNNWETVVMATTKSNAAAGTGAPPCKYSFDFIFDYTFFCALPPSLRPPWGEQVAALLHPRHGRLLTIIFPILPHAECIGVPYPVSVADYETVLQPWGIELEYGPYENPDTVPSRQGKEMIAWWKKK